MKLPSDEIMQMLSQEALRMSMETIRRKLIEFSESPMIDGLTAKEAMVVFANAMEGTSNITWGAKQ